MGQPLPPEIILPNGRTGYLNPYSGTYTSSRQYGLRMQRGYQRGMSQSDARGQTSRSSGLSEYQRRVRSAGEQGETPYQRLTRRFEQRYGFEYRYWRRLRRLWVDSINSRVSPEFTGAYNTAPRQTVTPAWIQQELQLNDQLGSMLATSGKPWIENRLALRLDSIIEYQDAHDKTLGYSLFHTRDSYRPVEWWWYH